MKKKLLIYLLAFISTLVGAQERELPYVEISKIDYYNSISLWTNGYGHSIYKTDDTTNGYLAIFNITNKNICITFHFPTNNSGVYKLYSGSSITDMTILKYIHINYYDIGPLSQATNFLCCNNNAHWHATNKNVMTYYTVSEYGWITGIYQPTLIYPKWNGIKRFIFNTFYGIDKTPLGWPQAIRDYPMMFYSISK